MHADGDADVLVVNDLIGLLVEAGVEDRELLQCQRSCFDRERQDGELAAWLVRVTTFVSQLIEIRDIGIIGVGDVGDRGLGSGHHLSDGSAGPAQGFAPDRAPVIGGGKALNPHPGPLPWKGRGSGGGGALDILAGDPAGRAGAFDSREVHAQLPGELAHSWGSGSGLAGERSADCNTAWWCGSA